jgi:hypothetical protein
MVSSLLKGGSSDFAVSDGVRLSKGLLDKTKTAYRYKT